jgi:Flp pilus assembly protein TadD/outer membrane protein OmpA-like peptidoglycan-associated protein
MKKQTIKVLALLAVAGGFSTGCDLLKDVEYACNPDPLEMHGDSVEITVDLTFPEKSLNKKAAVEFTPTLGSTNLKPLRVQGEKATGSGDAIQYKAGGKLTYTDKVPYKADMETAKLVVTGKIYKGEKEKGIVEATEICDACIITPYLVNKDFKVIYAEDKFERVTPESELTVINYLKGRSEVRSTEMRDDDVKELQAFLEMANENPKVEVTGINVVGYASPEGEEDKNNTLSTDRAKTGSEASMKIAKKAEHEKGQDEAAYTLKGSGEDYEGFKRELEADEDMDESDKQLVLRILDQEKNSATREQKMRDLGKSFTYLDRNIFPQLRRAEIITNYNLTGFSDEEMMEYSNSNPDTLDLEELLFCATLYTDLNEKLRVYKIAEERYPDDYRTSNNVGAVLYEMNKISEAKAKFEKSNNAQDNPIAKNNLGAVAGVEGDRSKAAKLFGQAGSANETSYNKGILNIQDGDYSTAVSNLNKGDASFNLALAQLLDGNASSVAGTLGNSDDADSAQGAYLKAIAEARQDNLSGVVSNLKTAIAKDGAYKAKAMKDREFIKYAEDATFSALVK